MAHKADAGRLFIQPDHPKPSLLGHDDAGKSLLDARAALDLFKMLKIGALLKVRVVKFPPNVQMPADDGALAGRIEKVPGVERLAVIELNGHIAVCQAENLLDSGFFADFRASGAG